MARTEIRAAIPPPLLRFTNLALAAPAEDLRFRATHSVYGSMKSPVTW
ncbi:hypothetical protein [Nonomuraea sp. 10N515B]